MVARAFYRFLKSNAPATIASTARMSPLWLKLILRKGAVSTPYRISQMAKTSIPGLPGRFIGYFLLEIAKAHHHADERIWGETHVDLDS
jgi:hypothetical protein